MPWDATRLRVARGRRRRVARDRPTSPPAARRSRSSSPSGRPTASSTSSATGPAGGTCTGWSTVRGWSRSPPMEAEFADPAWIFDRSTYGFLPDGSIVAVARSDGPRPDLSTSSPAGWSARSSIGRSPSSTASGSAPTSVVALAGSPAEAAMRRRVRPDDPGPVRGPATVDARSTLDPVAVSIPESIDFPTTGGRDRARPVLRARQPGRSRGPDGERPPLVVLSHGGPTANASTALDLGIQLLTSRGIAVVDVDYGGSTGYGRDVPAGARRRVGRRRRRRLRRRRAVPRRARRRRPGAPRDRGRQRRRLHDARRAGLPRRVRGRHQLVRRSATSRRLAARHAQVRVALHRTGSSGRIPRRPPSTAQRSPVHYLDEISCPVLVLQGLDDRVVPPTQAEAIVAALEANGIPHAYLAFEGEGHGFRGATAIRRVAGGGAVVPRRGLRLHAGRRHRAAGRSTASTRGATRRAVRRHG